MSARPRMLRVVVCSTALLFAVGCQNREVVSVIRVKRNTDSTPTIHDYRTYFETQAMLLKSSFVVAAALRNPEISELEVVQRQDDPIAWLDSSLKVDLAGESELLRVRMAVADDADQTRKIVDAVIDAYLAEIVRKEQLEKQVTLDNLRHRSEMVREQVRSKSDEIQDLERQLGTTTGHASDLANQQARITVLAEKQLDLELRLMELNHADTVDVEKQKRVVAEQIDYVRTEQEKELARLASERAGGRSDKLTVQADQLESLRNEQSAIQQDILQLEQDLAGGERIVVIQRATVP